MSHLLRNILRFLTVAAILVAVTACRSSKRSDGTLYIAVSIPPQEALLHEIAGDKAEIVTLLDASANPETFEITVAKLRSVVECDAYFKIGNMPFEEVLIEKIGSGAPDLTFYDSSRGIELLYGTHDHCEHHHAHGHHNDDGDDDDDDDDDDHHGMPDPHVWTSLRNMRIIAANMLDDLVALDPDNAEYYRTNYARLDSRLDSLDALYTRRLEPYHGASFMVWHPSLSYFARDYHLEQIAIGQENKEMSVIQLRNTLLHAAEAEASALFMQPGIDSSRAGNIARQLDINPTIINTLSPQWEEQFNIIVDAITSLPTDN